MIDAWFDFLESLSVWVGHQYDVNIGWYWGG